MKSDDLWVKPNVSRVKTNVIEDTINKSFAGQPRHSRGSSRGGSPSTVRGWKNSGKMPEAMNRIIDSLEEIGKSAEQ